MGLLVLQKGGPRPGGATNQPLTATGCLWLWAKPPSALPWGHSGRGFLGGGWRTPVIRGYQAPGTQVGRC